MKGIALVTGGTGFIGSHLAEEMAQAGWRVRTIVRNPNRLRWLQGLDVEVVKGDIDEPSSLPAALTGVELVIHCAGLTKANSRNEYFRVNAEGTRALLDASTRAGVHRFVYCSSQAAAGPGTATQPRTEDDPPEPLTDYGASKLAGERMVQESTPLEWIILRPPAVFGPRDDNFLPLFRMITKYRRYPAFGKEERLYSWIFVRDLVTALRITAETEKGLREIYFAASEKPVAWKEIALAIASVKNIRARPLPAFPLPVLNGIALLCEGVARVRGRAALFSRQKLAEIMAPSWVVSSEKIYRNLGFRCQMEPMAAVRETLEWYEKQGWL
jgi:nucleoside-diphosphate-sugar epimerase